MGFFKKLFRQDDEIKQLVKTVSETRKKVAVSPNYQLCCATLKIAFYEINFSLSEFAKDSTLVNLLISKSLSFLKLKGLSVPETYMHLPISFISNENNSVYGYIIELDDAKYMTECNFVALMICHGRKKYYTSEKTMDGKFKFCMFTEEGHYSINRDVDLQSPEEFKQKIFEHNN